MKKLFSIWQIAIAVSLKSKNCRHGTYVADTETCSCDKHWGTAGVTDTIDFLEGVCEQYRCVDDQTCRHQLSLSGGFLESDLSGVSCPIPTWNCYCGWKYAFMGGWHGYETPRNLSNTNSTGAECMGVMYTFSVWSYLSLKQVLWDVLILTLVFFVVSLCVGKNRARCDHHDPSLWKEVLKLFGSPPSCRGDCHVQEPGWTFDRVMDEFAWSFYALSLGIWTFAFLLVFFGLAMFAWSIVLWAMVILVLILAAVAGLCMLCGEGGGGHSCDCSCGGCDCCACDPGAGLIDDGSAADMMYWGGPHPGCGLFWCDCNGLIGTGTGTTGETCCCCCSWSGFCFPIAWLVLRFPRMPENMWGGLLGYCLGTHPFVEENAYRGGSQFIDFLGMQWMRSGDLRHNSGWRRQVHDFLYTPDLSGPLSVDLWSDGEGENLPRIGNASIECQEGKFREEECVESSFKDYKNNECWICREQKDIAWDLWLTCKHMYCQHCSEKMLQRRMPCPLCRVVSTTIWRRRGYKSNKMAP